MIEATPVRWDQKTQDEILKDLKSYVRELRHPREKQSRNKHEPFWSIVRIESEEEIERLKRRRNVLAASYFTYPVYFLGYTENKKTDRWFLPFSGKLLEIEHFEGATE